MVAYLIEVPAPLGRRRARGRRIGAVGRRRHIFGGFNSGGVLAAEDVILGHSGHGVLVSPGVAAYPPRLC